MNRERFYGTIPYVDKPVSRIFFGMAIQPFLSGGDQDELLDAAVSAGINAFDLARNYDKAEYAMGRWMEKRGCRDQVVLLSKCAHPDLLFRRVNEKAIREDFKITSEALRTDYIDIYILHRDDPKVPAGTVVEILNAMHAEGKIGAFGGSNWTHERIEAANEYAYAHSLIPFTVSSPNFGLAMQVRDPWGGGCVSISGSENELAREWYRKNQMPVIAYSSLGRGLFSGRVHSGKPEEAKKVMDSFAVKGYVCPENIERLRRCEILAEKKGVSVPQIAMRWIFAQDLNVFAVMSASKPQRIADNCAALEIEMLPEEQAWLNLMADQI